jgi:cellulose synthase (UDP-forming)
MDLYTLSTLQLLAPILFVIGTIYVLAPALPLSQSWARWVPFAAVWIVTARYAWWRLIITVLPAHGAWYEIGWVWFCYAVELLALGDALILYLILLRRTDRHDEADRHERRLRGTNPEQLPSVDVYIPTYNEPLNVLEKTITGALCLDYPKVQIWVLDDGRREWLKEFCESKGVGYIIRDNNAHAKAGNINHALTRTAADFVAVFDADFIPQQNFLMRTMGFFEDPKIGIVQVPHVFYNHDPLQANLAVRQSLPDDQRFFFEVIMPCRDAWDAAFCCGSNSVTRRSALRMVGDALPTDSITEDMLLTLTMLRQGFVTRYLCEPLAFGLAPESLKAFFVQRQRWARGGIQILFLRSGPLGPNLSFMHRLFFLPTPWLSQSMILLMTIIAPLVYLLTGILPLVNATGASSIFYILPMMLAMIGALRVYAPRQYFPLATQVLGTLQSFKLLPIVLSTLIKPHGHVFKVTPKGGGAAQSADERGIFNIAAALIALTAGGMVLNAIPDFRVIDQSALLPLVALWSGINIIVLFLVCMMSLQAPIYRTEERFKRNEQVWIFAASGRFIGHIQDVSLSGAAIVADAQWAQAIQISQEIHLFIEEVGFVKAKAVRKSGNMFAVHFLLPPSIERDLLIRRLFTTGFNTAEKEISSVAATRAILGSIVTLRSRITQNEDAGEVTRATTKLKPENLVIFPKAQRPKLADLAAQRAHAA